MNAKRLKPITEAQTDNAIAHWHRILTQPEARGASDAVKKAFEDAGIEADVSGPVLLAFGETSFFGRTYRYSAGKCPLWDSRGICSSLGFKSPLVVARLKKPAKTVRSSRHAVVKNLSEIRVQIELCAGILPGGKCGRFGPYPGDLHYDVKGERARAEAIDADPGWDCDVWCAEIYTDGREHGCRYQPSAPYVYSATQEGLNAKIADQIDWIARDLKIGKYAKA